MNKLKIVASSWLIYLNCMMMHGLANFKRTKFPLRLDYGQSPHAYVNQRLQIKLELLMMSGVPLETC